MRFLLAPLFAVMMVGGAAATVGFSTAAKHPVQTIYVRNLSSYVSDAEVKNDLPAFQAGVSKDFAPIWKIDAHFVFIGQKAAPSGAEVVTLLDKSDVQGALAYHELTDGVPDSKVFVGTSKYYGFHWTVGFTHEVDEMLVDPEVARAEQDPLSGTMWAGEVADPVEDDSLGYTRPGADGKPVLLSDFITTKWFDTGTAGPYDFLNHVQYAHQVLSGGYAQWWDGTTWVEVDNFKSGRDAAEHY